MPRIWKRIKKYERWVLLGIVIIVLATFSVSGQCARDPSQNRLGGGRDFGGSYEAAQGQRETVSSDDFIRIRERYRKVLRVAMWGPTLRWADEFFAADPSKERLNEDMATWAHIATVGAARAAGYEVGLDEIRNGVRKYVERATQRPDGRGGQPFSPELYERVLSAFQFNSRSDFETTVGEILLKDKYLAGWVDGSRFSKDRQEAFTAWKAEKERVDLEFAAVLAAQFAERVKAEEETRSAVARQTTALEKLVGATLEIRRIAGVVEALKTASKGVLPADTAALLASDAGKQTFRGKMPIDPWSLPAAGSTPMEPGLPYVYAVTGDTFTLTSSGPDRKAGTADDVSRATVAVIESLASLRRTADALVSWRATTDSWPQTLPDLTKVPPPAKDKKPAPPPLATLPKDAWDREFAYDPAGPALRSLGADGQSGTPDDLVATITSDRSQVPVPVALAPFLEDGLKDAWGRTIEIQLGHANPVGFECRSAGPDGVAATADDIFEGNEIDLLTFYNRARIEYRLPEKRHFEALYVIPCLVSNETLAAAWKKFPDFRPGEQAAFDFFRSMKGSTYLTSKKGDGTTAPDVDLDPADPKDGNGAALVERLRSNGSIPKDGKTWLVPSAEAFGEQGVVPAPKAGQPDPAADPLFKVYADKGWRRIVMRDLFLEKLVNEALTKCRTSSVAHKAWVSSGNTGPEPKLLTFTSELEELRDLQPGEVDSQQGARFIQYFSTKSGAPLSREEWEKLPELGDLNTSEGLKRLKEDDYAQIPTLLHMGTIHAAFHGQKIEAAREPELFEVREKVFPAYLEGRAMERASKELDAVAPKLKEKGAVLADVLAAAAKDRAFTYSVGRTGPFVGALGSRRAAVPEVGASDEAKGEARRRDYVRRYGYDVVKASGSRQDATTSVTGTVGRRTLKDEEKGDDSTRSAYLVRVAAAEDPSEEEFHGKDYATWLAKSTGTGNIYSNGGRVSQRPGTIAKQLGRVFDDWDEIKHLFLIETAVNVEMPSPKKAP